MDLRSLYSLKQRCAAEFVCSLLLLAAIVSSGIMAERLSGGNNALALLANSIAVGCALFVLILTFGPVSGAHFNPVVTLSAATQNNISLSTAAGYLLAQFSGALGGVLLAHAMFQVPGGFTQSTHVREGSGQFLSEFVATFGLMAVIWSCSRHRPKVVPAAVGAYITAAFWFTASTSFANPAVTLARCLTNTFTGIRPHDVPIFIAAQLIGGTASVFCFRWLDPHSAIDLDSKPEVD